MKRSYPFLLINLLIIVMYQSTLNAAACCGGGFAAPSIIAGDDKAQLTTSLSQTEIIVDNVNDQGIWTKWDSHQVVKNFKLEGAHLINDRWQVGASVPVIQRNFLDQTYSGLGDIGTTLGYEYLPDWNYNPYRPKGFGYLQITLPTGKSKAESTNGGLDSRGFGFWAIGIGTLLTKSWGSWDAFTSIDIHRSFGKNINTSQLQADLNPGYGGNWGLGIGFNQKDFRYGGGITWTYEDPIATEQNGIPIHKGSVEHYATATANVSYMANDDWSGTFSYTDQTVFGDPVNTSLGRGVAVQIQRRWSR